MTVRRNELRTFDVEEERLAGIVREVLQEDRAYRRTEEQEDYTFTTVFKPNFMFGDTGMKISLYSDDQSTGFCFPATGDRDIAVRNGRDYLIWTTLGNRNRTDDSLTHVSDLRLDDAGCLLEHRQDYSHSSKVICGLRQDHVYSIPAGSGKSYLLVHPQGKVEVPNSNVQVFDGSPKDSPLRFISNSFTSRN